MHYIAKDGASTQVFTPEMVQLHTGNTGLIRFVEVSTNFTFSSETLGRYFDLDMQKHWGANTTNVRLRSTKVVEMSKSVVRIHLDGFNSITVDEVVAMVTSLVVRVPVTAPAADTYRTTGSPTPAPTPSKNAELPAQLHLKVTISDGIDMVTVSDCDFEFLDVPAPAKPVKWKRQTWLSWFWCLAFLIGSAWFCSANLVVDRFHKRFCRVSDSEHSVSTSADTTAGPTVAFLNGLRGVTWWVLWLVIFTLSCGRELCSACPAMPCSAAATAIPLRFTV
jgi:hypothetical protein